MTPVPKKHDTEERHPVRGGWTSRIQPDKIVMDSVRI